MPSPLCQNVQAPPAENPAPKRTRSKRQPAKRRQTKAASDDEEWLPAAEKRKQSAARRADRAAKRAQRAADATAVEA